MNTLGIELKQRLGDTREQALASYNPDMVQRYLKDTERCWFGNAPTFSSLNSVYGEKTAAIWWLAQLHAINKISGAKGKMDAAQLEWTAEALANKLYFLKVTEAMIFIWKFRTQEYAKFYGDIDPDAILRSANIFLKEREEEHNRKFREETEKKRNQDWLESMATACTPEEAERILGRKLTF